MAVTLKSLLFLGTLLTSVLGHAVLVSPTPFNPNAVNSPPCGVSNMPSVATGVAAATWVVGSTVEIQWKKIAGDGGNNALGKLDLAGGTNFNTNAWTGGKPTPSLTTYNFAFTVPDVTCTNKLCTFQVISDSGNWVSCAFVNITQPCAGCPTAPPAGPECTKVGTLNFCTASSGRSVYIEKGASAAAIDNDSKETWVKYRNNTNVFTNGNSDMCAREFKDFLCALNLPPCPATGATSADGAACRSQCRSVISKEVCAVTESHSLLYDCDSLPLCKGEAASASLLSISLFSLLSVAAFALLL